MRYIEVKNCEECPYRVTSLIKKIPRCSLELHYPRVDLLEVYDECYSRFPSFCRLDKKTKIKELSK